MTMDMIDRFESLIDGHHAAELTKQNWTLTIWISIIYIGMIFFTTRWMSGRRPYDLKLALGVWSTVLAVFSIAGAVRTGPPLYKTATNSFKSSICDPSFLVQPPAAMWAFLFVISKVFELFDTAFIVLRKRPLIFLHWYHHFTVMVYCFYAYSHLIAAGSYFLTINYCVHSLMYTYYALKSFNVPIPKQISMLITFLQLFQMVVGVFINYKSQEYLKSDPSCAADSTIILWTYVMYGSYAVLFANFFYQSYLKPKQAKGEINGNTKKLS